MKVKTLLIWFAVFMASVAALTVLVAMAPEQEEASTKAPATTQEPVEIPVTATGTPILSSRTDEIVWSLQENANDDTMVYCFSAELEAGKNYKMDMMFNREVHYADGVAWEYVGYSINGSRYLCKLNAKDENGNYPDWYDVSETQSSSEFRYFFTVPESENEKVEVVFYSHAIDKDSYFEGEFLPELVVAFNLYLMD